MAVHIYTQTIHRTIQNKQYIEQHNNFGRVRAVQHFVTDRRILKCMTNIMTSNGINFIITTTTTNHHELGLFWSRLTVSSKMFQVIFIQLVYILHYFWYPVVYSCYMSRNECSTTFIQNFVKKNRSSSSKETLSLSVHKHTYILSLTLNHKKERKKEEGGSHWCTLTVNRKSCISHRGTCPRVLRILFQL